MEALTFENLPKAISSLLNEVKELKLLMQAKSTYQEAVKPEQLLTVQETADFLNLSVPTIYSKVSRGELPVMKQGKRLYFSDMELMEYLKEGRKKTYSELDATADEYLSNSKTL